MPYGKLNAAQRKALSTVVEGKVVHDLGAGDLKLSYELLKLGAASVVAVDKETMPKPRDARISTLEGYMGLVVTDPPDVVFLSWPSNRNDRGRNHIVSQSRIVAYLGKNTDGNACGDEALFQHLASRELLAYIPHRSNTLIIVGPARVERSPKPEEYAAISGLFMRYDVVEGIREIRRVV